MPITIDHTPDPVVIQCDAPGCPEHIKAFQTTQLVDILRGDGWYIGADTPPRVFCPAHCRAGHMDGSLPMGNGG